MINITVKQDCCGCTACAERCPHGCITMHSDEEGFLYPKVEMENCIDCGLCEKVCPIINENMPVPPLKVFAARHNNEKILNSSSSGGVFTAFAEEIINAGGVVFGARFDKDWNVVHSYSETLDGLDAFRGSKYVQSNIGNCYNEVERFLKQGRKVFFTGTPCQIAGLKHYLHKNYDNLLTADLICHGVPSPLVWSKYVETLLHQATGSVLVPHKKTPTVTGISFRDKRAGWRKYGFSTWGKVATNGNDTAAVSTKNAKRILFELQQQNLFLRGFLQELYLRPSCHSCRFRNFKSGSDFTMADLWGVEKIIPNTDDKGMSLILQKCEALSFPLKLRLTELDTNSREIAYQSNRSLFINNEPNVNRSSFFYALQKDDADICDAIEHNTNYCPEQAAHDRISVKLLDLGLYHFVAIAKKLMKKTT